MDPETTPRAGRRSSRPSTRSSAPSSVRTCCSSGCSWRCSPAATSSSRACPASPRRWRSRRSPRSSAGEFQRIQFTPDLVPADLVGTRIYNQRDGEFQVSLGPVFANLVLADEINRAPAKVQSALLEVMQERQVTIGRETYAAPDPFLVMATQNPIESEGVYALPEAQVDRFMLKVLIGYPSAAEEFVVVERQIAAAVATARVLDADLLRDFQRQTDAVYADPAVIEYAVALAMATRSPASVGRPDVARFLTFGASPRASINLVLVGPGARLPPGPRPRAADRRARPRPRRAPPPDRAVLRGPCRGPLPRRRAHPDPRRGAGALGAAARACHARRPRQVRVAGSAGLTAYPLGGSSGGPVGAGAGLRPERLLRQLEWRVIRRLDGLLQGSYRSLFRGSGLDFTDLREYVPGDDPRHIEWNVTARLDEPWVREYVEDRELTAWLVLDHSASMAFGPVDRQKHLVLAEVATTLAHVLTRGGNRVGAVLLDQGVEQVIPPASGRTQVLRIAGALLAKRAPSRGRRAVSARELVAGAASCTSTRAGPRRHAAVCRHRPRSGARPCRPAGSPAVARGRRQRLHRPARAGRRPSDG